MPVSHVFKELILIKLHHFVSLAHKIVENVQVMVPAKIVYLDIN